ncbi:unnamed protein product, partial [Discosporangium mesarthrocarpum]
MGEGKFRIYCLCLRSCFALFLIWLPSATAQSQGIKPLKLKVLSDGTLGGDLRRANRLLSSALGGVDLRRDRHVVLITSISSVESIPLAINMLYSLDKAIRMGESSSSHPRVAVLVLSLDGRQPCDRVARSADIHALDLTARKAMLCASVDREGEDPEMERGEEDRGRGG